MYPLRCRLLNRTCESACDRLWVLIADPQTKLLRLGVRRPQRRPKLTFGTLSLEAVSDRERSVRETQRTNSLGTRPQLVKLHPLPPPSAREIHHHIMQYPRGHTAAGRNARSARTYTCVRPRRINPSPSTPTTVVNPPGTPGPNGGGGCRVHDG
jgi:hypothetical protein